MDSINMKLSLPQEKVEGIISQCQMMLSAEKVSIRDLMKLIGRLSSSAIAVLPAPLQYRAIQRQQIQELASSQNYDSLVTLTEEVKEELDWWCQNLLLSNGRSLVQASPQLVIASDASLQGWGGCLQRPKNKWPVATSRTRLAHKYTRIEGSQTGNNFISSNFPKFCLNTYSNGQYNSSVLSEEDGRDSMSDSNRNQQGNLEISAGPSDHDYCGISTRGVEY